MLKTYRKAKVLVDESQATLNPTKELSYSMGNPEAEDEELVLFMAEIFACMLSPTVEKILQLKSNFQHKIAKEDFIAAAAIIAEQMAPNFNIKAEHRAEFLAYLQNSQLAAPKWLENSPNRAKIALLRGVICSLMQDCFYHKAIGTNYGCKDPTNTEGFAIPYSANNSPTFNSEYDITWETLLKTFHIYAHKNLKVEQALDLMLHLADRAKKESLEKGILLEETHEYQFIESLNLPNNDNLTNIDLSSKSLAILCQNDLFKLRYVAYLVAPDIRRYAEKATSTAQNMRSQFAEMITMSATPIDHKIYAPDPLFIADENESDRKVAKRLLDTAQNIFINESAPKKSLEQLINLTNNNQIRMLIDCGAMLKGLSNRFVAEQILNSSSHKGVLFFDQNEEMVVLEKGHKEPVPLSLSLLNPKDLFTYCDHKHIFGADTVQIEDAIGLCTVGVQTTYEEILQGAGRLRQLLVGQTAHFVTTTKDSTTEIFAKAKHNSKLEAEDKLFRAIKQQIHNEIRSRALSKILSCRTAKEALKIFAKTRQIFITGSSMAKKVRKLAVKRRF